MNWIKVAMYIPTLIGLAMNAVEKIKGAKGQEKEAAVIESIQQTVSGLEGLLDVDFVNNDNLNKLAKEYIAARVALMNGISAAKALKPAQ